MKGYSNAYGDIYRWKDIKATNTDIEAVYADLYGVINRCNFLLDNLDKVRANTNSDKLLDKLEQYEGEARLLVPWLTLSSSSATVRLTTATSRQPASLA